MQKKLFLLVLLKISPEGYLLGAGGMKITIDKRTGSVVYWGRPATRATRTHSIWVGMVPASQRKTLRPRVRTAMRLVLTGATRTQAEACRVVGLDQAYLSAVKRSPVVAAYIRRLEAQLDQIAINMSAAVQELGRRGLLKIAAFMESDQVKDELRLRAAMDLADRSPETSKTSKLSIEGDLTIREADANRLIAALVEASQADEKYAREVSAGDYIKVDDGTVPQVPLALPAPTEQDTASG